MMPPAVEVEFLEGWLTIADAAEILGLSRQRVFIMTREVDKEGVPKLKAKKVGRSRPVYLVREDDVERLRSV